MGYDNGGNGKRRVTMKDIATRAGVAPSTVSRAMRSNPWIPPHTRIRIKAVAAEMGYIPCMAARELKGRRSSTIGLCLSDLQDDVLVDQVRAIDQVALEHGFRLLVALSQSNEKREFECVQDFLERRMEGIVVFNPLASHPASHGPTPIVAIERSGAYASSNYLIARDAFDTLLELMPVKH